MKKWEVLVKRSYVSRIEEQVTIEIEADSQDEAESFALEEAEYSGETLDWCSTGWDDSAIEDCDIAYDYYADSSEEVEDDDEEEEE